ncbi:MAG: tol-pal system-associated acyl-CoA thioesterase [Caulobacterales bacterium]|nr:tol-pal system-associated acyl-CoA thioesterase [Caulobacterales bacterium]
MSPQPATGVFDADAVTHLLAVRVYYEDTDFSGVVYHARYVNFLERGRSDFLRACGLDHSALLDRPDPVMFAIRSMSLDFEAAARIDDALVVATRYQSIKGARIHIWQEIRRDARRLVGARVEAACVSQDGRARRAPPELLAAVTPRLAREAP